MSEQQTGRWIPEDQLASPSRGAELTPGVWEKSVSLVSEASMRQASISAGPRRGTAVRHAALALLREIRGGLIENRPSAGPTRRAHVAGFGYGTAPCPSAERPGAPGNPVPRVAKSRADCRMHRGGNRRVVQSQSPAT